MLRFLRDSSHKWEDRVKVARHMWKESSVQLPNKEQNILDWLTHSLFGKKHVPAGLGADCLWQCFHDVLHTNKCHQPTKSGQPLLLRAPAIQGVVNELSTLAACQPGHCTNSHIVISCCYKLITSKSLGSLLAVKYEYMLQLLGAVLSLCAAALQLDPGTTHPDLPALLAATTAAYTHCIQGRANPQPALQQFSTKIVAPLSNFMYQSQHCPTHQEAALLDLPNSLQVAMHAATFPKELRSYYELYMGLLTTQSDSKSVPPRFVEALFSAVCKVKDLEHLNLLPSLYRGFMQQYSGGSVLGFQFLQHVTHLLDILGPHKAAQTSGAALGNDVLIVLRDLLEVATEYEVHDMTDSGQTEWLKLLADKLLEPNSNSAVAWCGCLRALIQLCPTVMEGRLTHYLGRVCLTQSQDVPAEWCCLLVDTVNTYEQLRQVPKLVTRLVEAVREQSEMVVLPDALSSRLGRSFSLLSQGATLDVWDVLNKETSKYTADLGTAFIHTVIQSKMEIVFILLQRLLLSMQVAHGNLIPSRTLTLLTFTMDTAVVPTLKAVLGQDVLPSLTRPLLMLLHAWGELKVTWGLYSTHFSLPAATATAPMKPADLGAIYEGVSAKQWRQLSQKVAESEDAVCTYLWLRLQIQKICVMVRFTPSGAPLCELAELVYTSVEQLWSEHSGDIWDGKMSTLTTANLADACEQCLCENLVLLTALWSPQTLTRWTATWIERSCSGQGASGVSPQMLQSPIIQEGIDLQAAIVTQAWHTVASMLQSKASKKSPRKSAVSLAVTIETMDDTQLDLLPRVHGDGIPATAAQAVREMCASLAATLAAAPKLPPKMDWNRVAKVMQMLSLLPLEMLLPGNQVRCVVGCVALLHTLPAGKEAARAQSACVEVLTRTLEGASGAVAIILDNISFTLLLTVITKVCGCGGQLVELVLRHCVRSAGTLQQLTEHVQQLVELPNNEEFLMLTHQVALKSVSKAYIARDLQEPTAHLHQVIYDWLVGRLDAHTGTAPWNLLKAWGEELEYCCRKLHQSHRSSDTNADQSSDPLGDTADAAMEGVDGDTLSESDENNDSDSQSSDKAMDDQSDSSNKSESCSDDGSDNDSDNESESASESANENGGDGEMMDTDEIDLEADNDLDAKLTAMVYFTSQHVLKTLSVQTSPDLASALGTLHSMVRCYRHISQKVTSNFLQLCWQQLLQLAHRQLVVRQQKHDKSEHNAVGRPQNMTQLNRKVTENGGGGREGKSLVAWISEIDRVLNSGSNTEEFDLHLGDLMAMDEFGAKEISDFTSTTDNNEEFKPANEDRSSADLAANEVEGVGAPPNGSSSTETESIMEQTERCLALVVSNASLTQFETMIQTLLLNVDVVVCQRAPAWLCVSLHTWRLLLDCVLPNDFYNSLLLGCQNMMHRCCRVAMVIGQSHHHQCCHLLEQILQMVAKLLSCGMGVVRSPVATHSLHACLAVHLTDRPISQLQRLTRATHSVLNALLVNHASVVGQCVPAFTAAATRLMTSVIHHSHQRALQHEDALLGCALLVDRLFSLISTHQLDFGKVAPYIVAQYANEVHKVTLIPKVKRSMERALYHVLSLCDIHGRAQLQAALPPAPRHTYFILLQDYEKHHKYTGKV